MRRPYIALDVVGPGGAADSPIVGLIDTGADASVLPLGYATLLGYTDAQLSTAEAQQAQGMANIYTAAEPCIAHIAGTTTPSFSLTPVFVPGALNALWGRRDFLATFPVSFDEKQKEFVVTLPDPG